MALTEAQIIAQQESRARKKEMIKDLEAITKKHAEQSFYNKHEEAGDGFIKVPRNIMHYMNLQPYGFTTETIFIYQIIIQYTNKDTGCAYPSQYALAKLLKKTTSTVKKHVALLKKVGLVRVERINQANANRYIPLIPLSEAELLQRYPLAKEYHDEFEQSMIDFSAAETQRMRDYRAKKKKEEAGEM
ncbi:hypothetical protein CON23_21185 [Bacillus thuringiensis]|uniref:helix-turn-helix domain-containing protein n=1 Tax=Bacillus thuringiensis TaxID=1428 RepID=UPI000BECF9FB|nr:helix-turn-helix domain-containing protein [Bacillus thuringiensis]PEF10232.1 hypothetical protein CON23_21185 [Bacillus thuringiensis]